MPYLIDGHNLIPKIGGLSLSDHDDEQQLIILLQEFCRVQRKQVDVYFDHAPLGQRKVQSFGAVTAHFARSGRTADQEIEGRLHRLERQARNWTVVSSDRAVQASARAVRAIVVPSEDFARQLHLALEQAQDSHQTSREPGMSDPEIQDWLSIFGEDDPSE